MLVMSFQSFKSHVRELLLDPTWESRLGELKRHPLKKALGPLFLFFCDGDTLLKWRAVSAFGDVVSALALQEMEAARVIMRRLMWSLNEESGAIGWGAPEAFGESMAQSAALAREYHRILISYVLEPARGDGNYLEHEPLRRGAYWGLVRLAEVRPGLVRAALPAFVEGISLDDPQIRGLCAWGLGYVGDQSAVAQLKQLLGDSREVELYRDRVLQALRISDLAQKALAVVAAHQGIAS